MKFERNSGVLLHLSSLPSEFGIGDMGEEAYRFVDTLAENGFSFWQILPLGPIGPGNSPYQSFSAFAGEMLFISPRELLKWDLLHDSDLLSVPVFPSHYVDYEKVTQWKSLLLQKAWRNFNRNADKAFHAEFKLFQDEHNWWLNDYSLYHVCKNYYSGSPWVEWPDDLRSRQALAIEWHSKKFAEEIMFEKFTQFMFFRQWFRLKEYANQKGISIFGDLPLYVSHDSSDVWGNQNLFLLESDGKPSLVGGVPPDYFSEDGQLWGNPLYDWLKLAENDYQWWLARLFFNFHMYNVVRIDHFRGLESFWAVPADSETAKSGQWMPAKGYEMLSEIKKHRQHLPIVAEDLGIITPEVKQLRNSFTLPGMKVLQFAFASDAGDEHLPHNYSRNNIVYTGTHDNNTLKGWWSELNPQLKKTVKSYLGAKNSEITKRIIEMAWASTANTAIIPMQDILQLGTQARMNVPGVASGNWEWRYTRKQLKKEYFQFMFMLNKKYNRYNG